MKKKLYSNPIVLEYFCMGKLKWKIHISIPYKNNSNYKHHPTNLILLNHR